MAVVVDDGFEVAKHVAEWIRDGRTVERMALSDVRTAKFGHKCETAVT